MQKIDKAYFAAKKKPEKCLGSEPEAWDEWDNYGCHICHSRYHCPECGGGTGMMGHYIKVEDYEGPWCEIAKGD